MGQQKQGQFLENKLFQQLKLPKMSQIVFTNFIFSLNHFEDD